MQRMHKYYIQASKASFPKFIKEILPPDEQVALDVFDKKLHTFYPSIYDELLTSCECYAIFTFFNTGIHTGTSDFVVMLKQKQRSFICNTSSSSSASASAQSEDIWFPGNNFIISDLKSMKFKHKGLLQQIIQELWTKKWHI